MESLSSVQNNDKYTICVCVCVCLKRSFCVRIVINLPGIACVTPYIFLLLSRVMPHECVYALEMSAEKCDDIEQE